MDFLSSWLLPLWKDGKENENRYTQLSYMIWLQPNVWLGGCLFLSFVFILFCFGVILFKGLRALYGRLAYNDTMIQWIYNVQITYNRLFFSIR